MYINFQLNPAEETKRELNRELFVDKRMHPTMDDFLDDLGKAWTNLRKMYLQACQLLGMKRQRSNPGVRSHALSNFFELEYRPVMANDE